MADDDVTPLFGLIWWPTNYDPTQMYPVRLPYFKATLRSTPWLSRRNPFVQVVENIYTGPHAAHVPKSFKQALLHHSQVHKHCHCTP